MTDTPETRDFFVSYNGADKQWAEWIAQVLDNAGYSSLLQAHHFRPGQNFVLRMQEATTTTEQTIVVLSDNYLQAEYTQPEWAAAFAVDPTGQQRKLVPIRVAECSPEGLLKAIIYIDLVGESENGAKQALLDGLRDEVEPTGEVPFPGDGGSEVAVSQPRIPHPSKLRYSVSLPTTSHHLLGREDQLAALDAAWTDPHTHILTVVAPGGIGKTALVNKWLAGMAREDYRGARRVFGWSFYSQGTGESKNATGETFLQEALAWFGDPDPKEGSPWQRAERLAELLREQPTLLVLDGLEPLQQPPKGGMVAGRLKDPGLQTLLRQLAGVGCGLCVVTTREKVEDLESFQGETVRRIDLSRLSPQAGAAVLRAYDVQGPNDELEEAAAGFGGHALALTLLGTYLRDVCESDVRRWKEVPLLDEDDVLGKHARSILSRYETWLEEGPELQILYLLGLFDRPASAEEIAALRGEPAIPGLTDELIPLGEAGWRKALSRLRDARLLSGEGGLGAGGTLDTHPLVRTYFGERLKETNEEAFQAGHLRLYDHLQQAALHQPDTLEELQPLYHAVHHGCRASKVQEALDEVFWPRIRRGNEGFSIKKLGAFGSDLAALSGFFERPWERISERLTEPWQGFVLNAAGFDLRGQGRLAEAVAPMRGALELRKRLGAWKNGAINAGNLSELLLTLGRVGESVSAARESVELADRSGDAFERLKQRTKLADALHQGGKVEEARSLFEEAEAMQAERRPQHPLLYSVRGYRYCELLLAPTLGPSPSPPTRTPGRGEPGTDAPDLANGEQKDPPLSREGGEGGLGEGGQGGEGLREVLHRAETALEIVLNGSRNLQDIALNHLTLGRAHLYLGHRAPATEHLSQAVDGLRKAGRFDYVPFGLLARAELWRVVEDATKATADLDEAFEIAERGGMRLHLTDAHLERARLRLGLLGDVDGAREDVAEARALVEATGYLRRLPAVVGLERGLDGRAPDRA